jgi:hypothetical protein
MISAYGEKHMMLINQVAIYPNATVQLDSVNLLVLSKVVRRSCRRDSTQQCQHYHSINFMKYFTCKKKTCHWQGIQASTLSVGYGACPRPVAQNLWELSQRVPWCWPMVFWAVPMEMFDLMLKPSTHAQMTSIFQVTPKNCGWSIWNMGVI